MPVGGLPTIQGVILQTFLSDRERSSLETLAELCWKHLHIGSVPINYIYILILYICEI